MQKQLDNLSKNGKQSELDNFLKGKDMSDEQKTAFSEKTGAGYTNEDAYKLATFESNEIQGNNNTSNSMNIN